eukprot:3965993-Prymnesium_polylepis.1
MEREISFAEDDARARGIRRAVKLSSYRLDPKPDKGKGKGKAKDKGGRGGRGGRGAGGGAGAGAVV